MEKVRIDTKLNMEVWRKGIRHVPHKVRIIAERKQQDDAWVAEVSVDTEIDSFDSLTTQVIQ